MRNRISSLTIPILAVVSLVWLAPDAAHGQAPAAPTNGWQPARTPDGQPDIQGFWTEEAGGAEAVNIETALQTADSLRVQGWTDEKLTARKPFSSIVDPPNGKIPYQPWAEARRQQILSRYGGDSVTDTPRGPRDVSPELLCIIGTPRVMFFADFQVVQTREHIIMSWERSAEYRVIALRNDGPRLPAAVKLHMGDARGAWEGNTLVVQTTNLNDWGWFDSKGNFHTDAMTLVERFTPVDAKTLRYRVTVTDPKAFTRPWTMEWTLKQRYAPSDNYELLETACVEGERALQSILGTHP